MRIFAYMRYSSLNQKGNTSVETQRDAITRFVETMPELRGGALVERVDEAKSGTTINNRHALQRILNEAARGDAVVVFKYDRLGRNLLDSLQTLRRLEDRGVQVFSTSEPNTEVVRNLLLTMAQEFSRQLGERCKRALDSRAQSGNAANKAAFGYKIERAERNGPGKFVPVPEQAEIVRCIFKERSNGFSLYDIVKSLNDKGTPSPRGLLWRVGTVRVILHNEVYLGKVVSGVRKFKKGEGLQGIRPQSEWVVCENAHEPIISWDLWSAVRKLDAKQRPSNSANINRRSSYLWSGFLKCKHCGSNLIRTVAGRAYLGCDGGRKSGRKLACGCRYLVREEIVTRTVLNLLIDKLYSDSWVEELKAEVTKAIDEQTSSTASVLGPLEVSLKRLTQQIESASRRLVHVSDDMQDSFLDELQKLKSERENAKVQVERVKTMSGTIPNARLIASRIDECVSELNNLDNVLDTSRAREELRRHIDRIEIATDGSACLYGNREGLFAAVPEVSQGFVNIPTGI